MVSVAETVVVGGSVAMRIGAAGIPIGIARGPDGVGITVGPGLVEMARQPKHPVPPHITNWTGQPTQGVPTIQFPGSQPGVTDIEPLDSETPPDLNFPTTFTAKLPGGMWENELE